MTNVWTWDYISYIERRVENSILNGNFLWHWLVSYFNVFNKENAAGGSNN